jgi:hypothetical protein
MNSMYERCKLNLMLGGCVYILLTSSAFSLMHCIEYVTIGISTKSCQIKFVLVHINAVAYYDGMKYKTFLNP